MAIERSLHSLSMMFSPGLGTLRAPTPMSADAEAARPFRPRRRSLSTVGGGVVRVERCSCCQFARFSADHLDTAGGFRPRRCAASTQNSHPLRRRAPSMAPAVAASLRPASSLRPTACSRARNASASAPSQLREAARIAGPLPASLGSGRTRRARRILSATPTVASAPLSNDDATRMWCAI